MDFKRLPLVVTFLLGSALPHTLVASEGPENTRFCRNGDPTCGLPGIPQTTLLESLYKGLDDLPVGVGGRAIGFPADVLAAAYGIEATGSKLSLSGALAAVVTFPVEGFTPHYYSYRVHRAMLSRLEGALEHAKIQMKGTDRIPALVALNVPGIGPRIYDADQLRALVLTKLFPYPMRIEWKRASGAMVPYVQLDHEAANFVRTCLIHLGFGPNSKPETIIPDGCENTAGVSANLGTFVHAASPAANFLSGGITGTGGSTPPPGRDIEFMKDPKTNDQITKILLHGETTARVRVDTGSCALLQDIHVRVPELDRPDTIIGCEFKSDLYIPRKVGALYSTITVKITPIAPTYSALICGPDDKHLDVTAGITVTAPKSPCESNPKWELSGDILRPLPWKEDEPVQSLVTFVVHNKTDNDLKNINDEKAKSQLRSMFKLRVTLEGHFGNISEDLISWFMQQLGISPDGNIFSYTWCVPEDACPK